MWSEEDDKVMTSKKTVNSSQIALDSSSTENPEGDMNEALALEIVVGKGDDQQEKLDELTSMLKHLMPARTH